MKFSASLFVVDDIARARAFYEDILGQRVVQDYGANIAFDGGFSLQERKSWLAFIGAADDQVLRRARNAELYFETEALDDFLQKLDAHPEIARVQPLVTCPWGQRVIRIYDPDGHIVEVGESMALVCRRFLAQGMTSAQVAARAQQSLDYVLRVQRETSST
nr:VOC family protein [Maliibacterium massiliense]